MAQSSALDVHLSDNIITLIATASTDCTRSTSILLIIPDVERMRMSTVHSHFLESLFVSCRKLSGLSPILPLRDRLGQEHVSLLSHIRCHHHHHHHQKEAASGKSALMVIGYHPLAMSRTPARSAMVEIGKTKAVCTSSHVIIIKEQQAGQRVDGKG